MLEILTDITEGRGTLEHIKLLEELSSTISETASAAWENRLRLLSAAP